MIKILESLKNSCFIIKNEKYITHTDYCLFAAECSLMTVRKESSFNKEKKSGYLKYFSFQSFI